MADSKISALPAATSVAGSDVLPIVQSATTKQVSFTNVFKSPPALGTTTPAAVKATTLEATGNVTMANGTSLLSGTDTVLYVDANYTVLRGKATNGILFQDSAGTAVGQFTPTTNDFKVNVGNVVIGTSGKGIDFSATSGSGTSELLADYEEGTSTATLTCGTSGTITLTVGQNTLSYTKVGRVVTITGYISVASVSSPLGRLTLNGLPFTCANGLKYQAAMTVYAASLTATAITSIQGRVTNNSTTATIDNFSTGDSTFDLANKIQAGSNFAFSFSYFAA